MIPPFYRFLFVPFEGAQFALQVQLDRLLDFDVVAYLRFQLLGLGLKDSVVGELHEILGAHPDEILQQVEDEQSVVHLVVDAAAE